MDWYSSFLPASILTVVYLLGLVVTLIALYLVLGRPIFKHVGKDVLFWLMSVAMVFVAFNACIFVLNNTGVLPT